MLGPHPGSQLHSYRLTSGATHPRSDTVINTGDRDFSRVLRSRCHLSVCATTADHQADNNSQHQDTDRVWNDAP